MCEREEREGGREGREGGREGRREGEEEGEGGIKGMGEKRGQL